MLVVGVESIYSLKRPVGTRPASAPAMAFGSAGGFLAGFLIGAASHSSFRGGTSSAVNDGLSKGVLLGAPAGALVAWIASRSRPIYEALDLDRIRLRPRIVKTPSGGLGLLLSIPAP